MNKISPIQILAYLALAAGIISLSVWGGVFLAENPSSPVAKFLVKSWGIDNQSRIAAINEYLVFMAEDTPDNRRSLLASSKVISYVGDSLIPDVLVIRINSELPATLKKLRDMEFIRMVFRYDPAFGCH